MLQNEQIKNFGMIRLHHLNYMKAMSDEIWAIENILRESAVGKRMQVRSQLRAQYEMLRGFHMKHGLALNDMLIALSQSIRTKEQAWERLFDSRKESSLGQLTKMDGVIIAQKLATLDDMGERHERILQDCQSFFNDMTTSNFAVMSSLQEEVDDLKDQNRRLGRDLALTKAKYFAATQPLEQMQRNMIEWDEQDPATLTQFHTECSGLAKVLEGKLKCENNLEIMIEILEQQLESAGKELEGVKNEFLRGLLKLQRTLAMSNVVKQLRQRAARKDAAILAAVKSSKKSRNPDPLRLLHHQIEQTHRRVREGVNKMNAHLPSCSLPQTVNDDLREYAAGLRNKEGAILPPINPTPIYKKFQGMAQNVRTRIHYTGLDMAASSEDRDEPAASMSRAGAKDLAYGFAFRAKDKLPGSKILLPPVVPLLLPSSELDESSNANSILGTSRFPSCASMKNSEFFHVQGRPIPLGGSGMRFIRHRDGYPVRGSSDELKYIAKVPTIQYHSMMERSRQQSFHSSSSYYNQVQE